MVEESCCYYYNYVEISITEGGTLCKCCTYLLSAKRRSRSDGTAPLNKPRTTETEMHGYSTSCYLVMKKRDNCGGDGGNDGAS